MAQHQRRVQVEDQTRDREPGHRRGRQPVGLGGLRPRQFAGPRPSGLQTDQSLIVEHGQHPPRGRIGGHRSKQIGLIAQHRQIRDGLATVGKHHRQVQRDPTRIVPRFPLSQPRELVRHRLRQASHVGQIDQQPGTRMADHATPVRRDNDLGTGGSTLHLASALRLDRRNLRQVLSSQVEGHFYVCGTLNPARLLKGPG
jgi:hypothetical protein